MALPDLATLVAQANKPGGLDVGLKQSFTTPGRLTWRWDGPGGDLAFDTTASWPVLSTVFGRKGLYRFDRTLGTQFFRVVKDRRSTGSQLASCVRDGAAQVEADQLATEVTGVPRKIETGKWRLTLRWISSGQRVERILG